PGLSPLDLSADKKDKEKEGPPGRPRRKSMMAQTGMAEDRVAMSKNPPPGGKPAAPPAGAQGPAQIQVETRIAPPSAAPQQAPGGPPAVSLTSGTGFGAPRGLANFGLASASSGAPVNAPLAGSGPLPIGSGPVSANPHASGPVNASSA